MAPSVAEIWRYPVKSMLGERLAECEIGRAGLAGDRSFALIDLEDGKVASAKNPHKWASLLSCRAALSDESLVEITLPDGSRMRSDDPGIDAALSEVCGRGVHLASTAPDDRAFEEVWPDIDGLAPQQVIDGTNIGTDPDGEKISQFPLGSAAPSGTFFDVSVLHLLTTQTLAQLQGLAPDASFDVRRYRPNLVIETGSEPGFVENGWVGRLLRLGDDVEVSVTLPTMRCVMTTLAQEDLPRDRETLRTIAAANRIKIEGMGTWACAGVYGDVATAGVVRVGDAVALP